MTIEATDRGNAPTILGWQEWVALPALGLPAITAKIDTGARTSALHAAVIEPVRDGVVRFLVQPVPKRPEIEVWTSARALGERVITSSNGDQEQRVAIATDVVIDGRQWSIEVTLTNRAQMRSRMLLGRQALQTGLLIDPTRAFLMPRLGYKLYPGYRRRTSAKSGASSADA